MIRVNKTHWATVYAMAKSGYGIVVSDGCGSKKRLDLLEMKRPLGMPPQRIVIGPHLGTSEIGKHEVAPPRQGPLK